MSHWPESDMIVLIDAHHLGLRVKELAAQIEADMVELNPVLVVVLKGGFLFGADLIKAFQRPFPVVFAAPRSQREDLLITPEDEALLHGRDVIMVDNLMDAGGSLLRLRDRLQRFHPASIRVAVLLHKTVSNAEPLRVNYLGFEVPDVRVVGYGLDEDQRYRGLESIYTWLPSHRLPKEHP